MALTQAQIDEARNFINTQYVPFFANAAGQPDPNGRSITGGANAFSSGNFALPSQAAMPLTQPDQIYRNILGASKAMGYSDADLASIMGSNYTPEQISSYRAAQHPVYLDAAERRFRRDQAWAMNPDSAPNFAATGAFGVQPRGGMVTAGPRNITQNADGTATANFWRGGKHTVGGQNPTGLLNSAYGLGTAANAGGNVTPPDFSGLTPELGQLSQRQWYLANTIPRPQLGQYWGGRPNNYIPYGFSPFSNFWGLSNPFSNFGGRGQQSYSPDNPKPPQQPWSSGNSPYGRMGTALGGMSSPFGGKGSFGTSSMRASPF